MSCAPRAPRLDGEADLIVIRPSLLWRLGFPTAGLFWFLVQLDVIKSKDGNPGLWGWGVLAMIAFGGFAAFRQRVTLQGSVLLRQGTFRAYQPLRADSIAKVTLHYEAALKDIPHRVLRLETDSRTSQDFSLRWWGGWRRLAVWLRQYCTTVNDERQRSWRFDADDVTRRRLQAHVSAE